jgi:hypothetical protein
MIRRHILRFLTLGFLLSGMFINTPEAFGRAGGGGGYGGGGGFSGGGGGFSSGRSFGGSRSGGGRGKSWSEMTPSEKRNFKIFIIKMFGGWLIFAFFFVVAARLQHRKMSNMGPQVSNSMHPVRPEKHQEIASIIQTLDPSFDPDHFKNRFQIAFHAVQNAWQNQDMDPVQHMVSDGIHERFSLQIQEQIDEGYRNKMDQIKVQDAVFADHFKDAFFETLTVQVNASCLDYRMNLKTGEHISGSRSKQIFTEYWSFVRRIGAQTKSDSKGLIEGQCPNCDAPIQMNQTGSCEACKSLLRSGEYDWVLAEITQSCEWKPGVGANPTNLATYQSHDPGFHLQHIEDRASVIFWRKAMSDRTGKIGPLMKMASHDFCKDYEPKLAMGKNGYRGYFGDCAVGSVDLLGLICEQSTDHALIAIHWAGHQRQKSADGKPVNQGWMRQKSLFVLSRNKGVQTNLSQSIQSAHCPACGGAESNAASHACEYCGVVLNSGDNDWVLTEQGNLNSKWARDWTKKLNPSEAKKQPSRSDMDLMEWVIQTVAADQLLKTEERKAVATLCLKLGLDEHYAEGLLKAATQRHGESVLPPDHITGRKWIEAIADIALADGEVSEEERSLMSQLGHCMEWSDIDIKLLINKRRSILRAA